MALAPASIAGLAADLAKFQTDFPAEMTSFRNPHASNIEGNVPLEIAWTVIPLGLFMVMFYLGWQGYLKISTIPEEAVPVRVTARMWSWTFAYPNGVTTDTLWVPVNVPVKLLLTSADVRVPCRGRSSGRLLKKKKARRVPRLPNSLSGRSSCI